MKLLLDMGNTRLKWALLDGKKFLSRGWLNNTSIECAGLGCVVDEWKQAGAVESVYISSVVGDSLTSAVVDELESGLSVQVVLANTSHAIKGFSNNYQAIDKLGVDRWLAVVGARSLRSEGALIVVDAGTAVTVDLLDSNNVFQGGAIMPGLSLMHDALTGKTANIEASLMDKYQIVGKNTEECVNSGVAYGLVGGIERVVEELVQSVIKECGESCQCEIIITGGATPHILPELRISAEYNPDLVILGLLEYAVNY